MPGNLYLLFFSFACPKEKNQKKKTPGSLACGFPCKIACRALPETRFAQRGPATSPPALQFCFGCAAWDKRSQPHNNEDRLVEIWDGKVASGSLIASYYHAFFGAKARANGLCGFSAIIDMSSKNGLWTLMDILNLFCVCALFQLLRAVVP